MMPAPHGPTPARNVPPPTWMELEYDGDERLVPIAKLPRWQRIWLAIINFVK